MRNKLVPLPSPEGTNGQRRLGWAIPIRVSREMIRVTGKKKKGTLAEIGDVSRNSGFSVLFCHPGFFGFAFEKWDLS